MNIQWVKQEHARGCGVACMAMLTGKTYAEVYADFDVSNEIGINSLEAADWLFERGLGLVNRYKAEYWPQNNTPNDVARSPWPPEPFSDLHLCTVDASPGQMHFVVMLGDGTVLDPLTPEPKRLTDYHEVRVVAAVVPIPLPVSPPQRVPVDEAALLQSLRNQCRHLADTIDEFGTDFRGYGELIEAVDTALTDLAEGGRVDRPARSYVEDY